MLQLKRNLPKKEFKKITNLQLFYVGFHNRTYTGFYNNEKVQIRLAINDIVDHSDEFKIISSMSDYLFISKRVIIRKWYDGGIYENNTKTDDYKLLDLMGVFWKQNKSLSKMNWLYYKVDDEKYHQLLEKYKDDFNENIHGDIRRKNIIKNNEDIKLIDFEWVRSGSKYFDITAFMKFTVLTKEETIDYLKLDKDKLEDYLYLEKIFNGQAYYQVYDHIKDYYIGEIKKP